MQLSDIQKFLKKYWKVSAVIGGLAIGLVMWIRFTDPHIDEVKKYLLSNGEVCANLGIIKKLSLKRSTILLRPGEYGRAQESDRKIYTFVATGTKGRERIRVNVKISETDEIGKINIEC